MGADNNRLLAKLKRFLYENRWPIALFLLAFFIYNINLRLIGSGDTKPAALLPFSIIFEHNLYFDQFAEYFSTSDTPIYFFGNTRGHWVSAYPITLPIIATPLYWLVLTFININPADIAKTVELASAMEKFTASLIASTSVVFMYLLLKKITNKQYALILTLVYAFGTNTWVTSSQALWQQGFSVLVITMALYTLFSLEKRPNLLIFTGLLTALAVTERFSNIIFAIILTVYVFYRYRPYIIKFLSFPVVLATLFIYYNMYYYGSLIGGYAGNQLFGNPLSGLFNLMLNPNRGLFIYSPITIFGFIGLFYLLRNLREYKHRDFYLITIISFISGLAFLATWPFWWGGAVYGPRIFVDLLPFLIILMVPFLEKLNTKMLVRFSFATLATISVFVQIIGAFYYNGQEGDYLNVRWTSLRYWKSTQIGRHLKAGPLVRPYVDFAVSKGWVKPLPSLDASKFKSEISVKRGLSPLEINELASCVVEIKNTSDFAWPKGYGSPITKSISLSYRLLNKAEEVLGEGTRNTITRRVNPGEKIRINALITAPTEAGDYIVEFGVMQEGVAWFEGTTRMPIKVIKK